MAIPLWVRRMKPRPFLSRTIKSAGDWDLSLAHLGKKDRHSYPLVGFTKKYVVKMGMKFGTHMPKYKHNNFREFTIMYMGSAIIGTMVTCWWMCG